MSDFFKDLNTNFSEFKLSDVFGSDHVQDDLIDFFDDNMEHMEPFSINVEADPIILSDPFEQYPSPDSVATMDFMFPNLGTNLPSKDRKSSFNFPSPSSEGSHSSDTSQILENSDSPKHKTKRKRNNQHTVSGSGKGAWTPEEHDLFLQGLTIHGKGKWKEISKLIGSRSRIQCASHWQKYHLKVQKHRRASI